MNSLKKLMLTFQKPPPEDDADVSAGNKKEFRETSEDSYVLMEGNIPYTGSACVELTEETKNKFLNKGIPSGTDGIYASISSAFNDLSQRGLDGPVTFLLVDNLYSSESFPIVLSELNGSSAVNTFTLKPSPGISPQIVMSSGSSVIKIYNSQYINIDGSNTVGGVTRDLSIISNDANISYGIWIGSKSGVTMRDITVKNCIIKTGENSLGSTPILIADGNNSSAAGLLNNVSILNNVFQKGRQGIFVNGGTTPQGITNLTINGNIINSTGTDAVGFMGIYVQGVNNCSIRSNEIGNLNTSGIENDKGIWVANGSHSVKVERNKIYNLGYTGSNGQGGHGIYISANHINAFDTICNNLIYNIYGDGWNYLDQIYYLDNPAGIALYSSTPQSGISLLNNSVNLYGNTLLNQSAASFGIFVSTNTTLDIKNNVISNNLGIGSEAAYGSCGVYAQNSHTQFAAIDYNNYYINPTGNGVKAIGKISSTNTSTSLNNWRGVTLQDRSSISYNPGFTSNTDLSPDINSSNAWSLNGRGQQNSSVFNDYNGNPRSITVSGGSPDIGAFEFTPASQPPSITGVGAISDGGNTLFILGSDTVASIVWHGADLPAALTLKYFSGTNPPSPSSGKYGNSYWVFEPTGGSGYTFDMTLYWDPAAIGTITGVNNITMANYTSSVWEHYDAAVNVSARNVTKTGLTKLTTFTIDDFDDPLPVTMLYFNHSIDGRNVILKWATSFEINNKGFEIEKKSEFNSAWKKIGFINGKGNSNTENYYEYKDLGLATGKYNYRLKQIDYAGNAEYYNLSTEVIIGKPANFSIGQNYPNPSNPKAKIDYQVPFDSKLSIKVYDIQGREVNILYDGFSEAGYYSIEFDGTSLASGIYFYRIVSAHYTKTMKLILVK